MASLVSPEEEKIEMNVFCVPVKGKRDPTERWELPTKWLGKKGSFGSMAEVCKKGATDCDHVMKIMSVDAKRKGSPPRELRTHLKVTPEQFEKEVELQKEAAVLRVAPPVCDSWECPLGEDEDKDPSIGVIIMPILQKTLKDVLDDDSVEDAEKEAYILEAKSILKELNGINIQHRDCKLENFMIDGNGKLKIIDFGLAQKFEPCDFNHVDMSEWSIPSSPPRFSGFFEFFGELNNIQKNLGLGGAIRAAMVQAAAEKHLKIYNERFRRRRSPIQTSHKFIAIACARYNEEFYDEDKSMLDERVQKNKEDIDRYRRYEASSADDKRSRKKTGRKNNSNLFGSRRT